MIQLAAMFISGALSVIALIGWVERRWFSMVESIVAATVMAAIAIRGAHP